MDCKHPSGMVQYLGHTAWQWCTLCGSLYHPGPGATWERPKGYDKMAAELAAELAKTNKALGNLLSRVKFDDNTPPGEHWHVMAVLMELVQENDRLKAEKG